MCRTRRKPDKTLRIYQDFQPQVGRVWRNVGKEKYLKKLEHLMMPGQINLHLPMTRVAHQYA